VHPLVLWHSIIYVCSNYCPIQKMEIAHPLNGQDIEKCFCNGLHMTLKCRNTKLWPIFVGASQCF